MLFDLPELVHDEELTAVLEAALRSGGGRITRALSCHLAGIAAEHLVDKMKVAGLRAVRVPERVPLKD